MATSLAALVDTTIEDPTRRAPLVTGTHDYASVTDAIVGISERKTPLAWYIAFTISSSFTMLLFSMIGYLIYRGVGVWGNNSPVFWAWDIVNFVFLGWYRSRRDADFGHPVLVPTKLADQHQPLRRSDDHFRRLLCRDFPGRSRRPGVVCLLAVAGSVSTLGHVAEFSQPLVVGRLRGQHLRHCFAAVLVHGDDP